MVPVQRPRFIRLVTNEIHVHSGHALGVFHAVRYLRDDGGLSRREEAMADRVFDWVAEHLKAPPRGLLRKHPRAVSWFHWTARQHIVRAETLARLLENKGISVRRLERVHPGRIVFTDKHQIFAFPRARSLRQ
jgi:hypothetical protein